MKTLILYQSFTGNTEKVTRKIEETLELLGLIKDVLEIGIHLRFSSRI